jgi:hypothetical protein
MVKPKENRKRVNIYVNDDIHAWYMQGADDIGISMSGYMAIALKEYMEQKTVLKNIDGIKDVMNAINQAQKIKNELPIKE